MRAKFSQMSVQMKMLFVVGTGMLGFLLYFAFNHFILQQNRDTLQKIVSLQMPTIETTENLIKEVGSLRSAMTQAVISQNFDGVGKIDSTNQQIVKLFKKWPEQAPTYTKIVDVLEGDYLKSYGKLSEMVQNIVAGLATVSESQESFQKEMASLSEVEQKLIKVKAQITKNMQDSVVNVVTMGRRASGVGVGILLLGILMSIGFYFMMSQINSSLLNTNSGIQDTSKRLLEMVEEALVSSQHLRQAANRQAASSTETVVSMEEMKRIIAQTSRSSSDARDLSEASLNEATNGKDLVQALKNAMTDIENTNKDLQAVTEVVKLVRENTKIINEIVFKTQLLSFNANIEAARAGQHGLGFAVVANEIGNLAEMSGKAAEEINELLEKSTAKVDQTIGSTKEKIEKANDLSAKCYEFFKVITERSGQLKHMVNSISQATAEQNTGVEYVVNAMNELNQTASETDRMAQGMSMLADSLKGQSLSLSAAADRLNSIVRGGDQDGDHFYEGSENVTPLPEAKPRRDGGMKFSA